MSYIAAIDISTFIWCRNDYERNKNKYYKLLNIIPSIYEKIKSLKIPVLIREEFYDLIWVEFPYNMAPELSYDFERLTLSFLTDTFSNWVLYANNNDDSVSSIPELAKPHFCDNARTETQSQICHLFENSKTHEHKFIAYSYFFNQKKNLVLTRQQKIVKIDTLCYDSESEIQDFFDRNMIKFEHNPKHNVYNSGGMVSPLSCYNDQDKDTTKAQFLLNYAFLYSDDYYNFDVENGVYVKFIKTTGLTYHGFDLSDNNNNVPNEVKKKFNKSGRVF
jgi:hypothetical protein